MSMKPSNVYEFNHHAANIVGMSYDTYNNGRNIELKIIDGDNQVENNKINAETNKSKGINPL